MSIYLELVDFDKLFRNLQSPPLIVNNFDVSSMEEKEKLNELLYTRYAGDALEVVPHCDCNATKGEFNLGVICKVCSKPVQSVTEKPLESLIWIAAPEGVRGLVNPEVWNILSGYLTVSNCNLMEWFCSPSYRPPTHPPILDLCPTHWKRSINYFIDNFDEIIDTLLVLLAGTKNQKARKASLDEMRQQYSASGRYTDPYLELREFIAKYKPWFFPKYLPFPSRIGFITESTAVGMFVDTSITSAVDAIRTITSIESSVTKMTQLGRESRTVKAISLLSTYYTTYMRDVLGGKTGVFRKHIFGGRTHFTGRAVISSLSEQHNYEEVHFPWGLSVQLFRVHLTNLLLKRKYTPNEITAMFYENVNRHSPLFEELFQQLIDESPHMGLPIMLQRNPTLARGSAQLFYVTKVKPDPSVYTISMSVLCLKAPNADFDGDELNTMAILDAHMHESLSRFAPHLGAMDLMSPMSASGNMGLPGPLLATANNWLTADDEIEA